MSVKPARIEDFAHSQPLPQLPIEVQHQHLQIHYFDWASVRCFAWLPSSSVWLSAEHFIEGLVVPLIMSDSEEKTVQKPLRKSAESSGAGSDPQKQKVAVLDSRQSILWHILDSPLLEHVRTHPDPTTSLHQSLVAAEVEQAIFFPVFPKTSKWLDEILRGYDLSSQKLVINGKTIGMESGDVGRLTGFPQTGKPITKTGTLSASVKERVIRTMCKKEFRTKRGGRGIPLNHFKTTDMLTVAVLLCSRLVGEQRCNALPWWMVPYLEGLMQGIRYDWCSFLSKRMKSSLHQLVMGHQHSFNLTLYLLGFCYEKFYLPSTAPSPTMLMLGQFHRNELRCLSEKTPRTGTKKKGLQRKKTKVLALDNSEQSCSSPKQYNTSGSDPPNFSCDLNEGNDDEDLCMEHDVQDGTDSLQPDSSIPHSPMDIERARELVDKIAEAPSDDEVVPGMEVLSQVALVMDDSPLNDQQQLAKEKQDKTLLTAGSCPPQHLQEAEVNDNEAQAVIEGMATQLMEKVSSETRKWRQLLHQSRKQLVEYDQRIQSLESDLKDQDGRIQTLEQENRSLYNLSDKVKILEEEFTQFQDMHRNQSEQWRLKKRKYQQTIHELEVQEGKTQMEIMALKEQMATEAAQTLRLRRAVKLVGRENKEWRWKAGQLPPIASDGQIVSTPQSQVDASFQDVGVAFTGSGPSEIAADLCSPLPVASDIITPTDRNSI